MTRYRINPARSRVVIDARSNVHEIHTEATGLRGWVELAMVDGDICADPPPRGHLEFPVDNLHSGNALEDRELRRRIDARRFPMITGDLRAVRDCAGDHRHLVKGELTFRGVARVYEHEMTIEGIDGDTVRMAGRSRFDIRDFGMEPPRILMLKVHPDVVVTVDIVADEER